MAQPNTPVPWHEVGIRISAHGIASREAEHNQAIVPSDIVDVFVRRSWLSWAALLMPVICLVFGLIILVLYLRTPGLPWWSLFLSALFLGYAGYSFWYYLRTRRHTIFISAPSIAPNPIRFYITESAREADELVAAIRAVTRR